MLGQFFDDLRLACRLQLQARQPLNDFFFPINHISDQHHSPRSVTAGSTRPALRAGPSPASKAITSNTEGANASATASALPTPNNWLCNARPAAHVATNPIA